MTDEETIAQALHAVPAAQVNIYNIVMFPDGSLRLSFGEQVIKDGPIYPRTAQLISKQNAVALAQSILGLFN